MSGHEPELVQDAFASNGIAPLGPHVDGFEREFASPRCEGFHASGGDCRVASPAARLLAATGAVGVPHAAALSSGTAALHLAMQFVSVERGDEVLDIVK
jgi:pyridoxal phosphate-dependent aminotransferase EpsN